MSFRKVCTPFLVAVAFFASSFAKGNDEEQINSRYGGTPFLAVSKGKGSSQREVGFYSRDLKDRGWIPLLLGDILLDPRKGSIQYELSMSALSGRFDVLAVIDGYVTLFNADTQASSPASYARLGSADHPVVDPVSGQQIRMGPLTTTQDLSITTSFDVRSQVELVLVSVRSQNVYGDGLTFAVAAKVPSTKDGRVELLGKPVLLDYRFLSQAELSSLVVGADGKTQVFSKWAACAIAAPRFSDHPCLASWKGGIRELSEKYTKNHRVLSDAKDQGLPVYDFERSQVVVEKSLAEIIFSKGIEIKQELDALSGQGMVMYKAVMSPYMGGPYSQSLERRMRGSVDYQLGADGKPVYKIYEDQGEPQSPSALVVIDGALYYIRGSTLKPNDLSISMIMEKVDASVGRIQFYSKRIHGETGAAKDYLIVSFWGEKLQGTLAFRVNVDANRRLTYETSFVLSMKPLIIDPAFMAERAKSVENRLLLDLQHPDIQSVEEFKALRKETAPYVDLTESAQGTYRYDFVKPLQSSIVAEDLVYLKFDDASLKERKSGVYSLDQDKHPNSLITSGAFLDINTRSADNGVPLIHHAVQLRGYGYTKLTAFFMDQSFGAATESSTALLALYLRSEDQKIKKQLTHIINLETSFGDIVSVAFEKGLYDATGEHYLFVTTKQGDKSKEHYVLPIKAGFDETTSSFVIHSTEWHQLPVDPSKVGSKSIFYDNNGSAYLSLTPDLDFRDRELEIFSLMSGRKVKPNGPNNRGVKLIPPDQIQKLNEKKGFFDLAKSESWHLKGRDSARQEIKDARVKGTADLQLDAFPSLLQLFESIADPAAAPEHYIVTVPSRFKAMIKDMILFRWQEKKRKGLWSHMNRGLRLFMVDEESKTQLEYVENLESARDYAQEGLRAVVFADLVSLRLAGRPGSSDAIEKEELFKIEGAVKNDDASVDDRGEDDDDDAKPTQDSLLEDAFISENPHALYWLATEGAKIPLKKFQPGTLRRSLPTVILATDEEWSKLESELNLERYYGVTKDFKRISLDEPNQKALREMLYRNLSSKEIQDLRYTYHAEGIFEGKLTSQEAMQKIVDYIVSRAHVLSKSNQTDFFTSFMKLKYFLMYTLINDENVRTSRVINQRVIEKVISQVFNIQINVSLLPPDDPDRVLISDDAIQRFTDAGYIGSYDLKKSIFDALRAKTRSNPVLPIPSSLIVVGESGTGKTQIFYSLSKMLGLKFYNFKDPLSEANRKSNAIIIDVTKIANGEKKGGDRDRSEEGGKLDVHEVIRHLEHFLSLPEGSRGL